MRLRRPRAQRVPLVLIGFDPRFEEALLVLNATGELAMVVGDECFGLAGAAPCKNAAGAVPEPEPAEQPRDTVTTAGGGVVGWKTYARRDLIDAPAR